VSSRLRRALPVLGVFVALAVLYIVEAFLHHSPWIFFDELDYSTTARRIADLGTPPGGKPYHFNGLYPFLIAPAWLADDVHTAYWVSKVIGALVMTAAVFPAYWLARMLAAPRLVGLFTAAATAAVPALSYTSSLMTETLAYPYAVLCFALIVRALSSRSTGWVVGAAAASILAPVVRKELAVIPVAFAATALAFVALPWLGRSWRRWAVAIGVTLAGLVLAGWALKYVSTTWSVAIGNPRAMISYARSGVASVVVGVAILPATAGLAALVPPRGERRSPARNAFACLFVAAAAGFLLYTAAKGVYFGPTVANPIEERNLIYLAPLFLAGTAVWLSRRAVEPIALVAATAIVLWLLVTVPLQFRGVPASDAPSLEALGAIGWSDTALKGLLAGIAVLSAVIILRRTTWLLAGACLLVLAWSLGSEIYASRRSADYAAVLARTIPRPFEWIDRATDGGTAVYVGQEILQPTDIWLQSFWNPSLVQMRTLDGTPTVPSVESLRDIPSSGDFVPVVVRPDGSLPVPPSVGNVVADQGITGAGPRMAAGERWRLYADSRLHSTAVGVYTDGWMGGRSTYTVYTGAPRWVTVRLSRAPYWCGTDVPGHAAISVNGEIRARADIHACRTVVRTVPAPKPPFRVAVTIQPTFRPAALDPSSADVRQLGAVVTYSDAPPH
jgi:hypothetical protein